MTTEEHFGPLVTTGWLADHLDRADVRVLDCRWYLRPFDERCGDEEYAAGHIPGAVHVRWDTGLADPDRPGSMLARAERFEEAMSRLGVGDHTTVVTYDDLHVPVAARVRWALRVHGHERVAVLDGGLPAWRRERRPTTVERPVVPRAVFTSRWQATRYAEQDDVRRTVDHGGAHLLDARMDVAWDAAGGHIPGARRLAGLSFLTAAGTWVSPEEARALIGAAGADDGEPVIAYCGGGVAATGTALGFELAGLGDVAVYDGSWTEWGADPSTPKAWHRPDGAPDSV
jgi:thiosulfate/3-mercaptopyruvate sulfurtransferase